MSPIRVLVVDDSVVVRRLVSMEQVRCQLIPKIKARGPGVRRSPGSTAPGSASARTGVHEYLITPFRPTACTTSSSSSV